MTEPAKSHSGVLRPRIAILAMDHARVEWFDPESQTVIWTEECRPPNGWGFASQIVCSGDFSVQPGHFIDADGKRHYVLKADTGQLGALFNQ